MKISTQKGFTPILILFLIIGLVAGTYLLGKNNSLFPQSQVTPTSSPVSDETMNWKTYNLGNTLSFKYPSDFYPDLLTSSKDKITIYNKDPRKNPSNIYYLSIETTKGSFELFVNNGLVFRKGVPKVIAGRDGMQVFGLDKPGGINEEDYFFNEYPNVIHIAIGNIPSDQDTNSSYIFFRKTVDQILSTFKFSQ